MSNNPTQIHDQPSQSVTSTETIVTEPFTDPTIDHDPGVQNMPDDLPSEASNETASQPAESTEVASADDSLKDVSAAEERQERSTFKYGNIKIGGRRKGSEEERPKLQPQPIVLSPAELEKGQEAMAGDATTQQLVPTSEPVPKPTRRDALTPDLERELDKELGGMLIDDLMSTAADNKAGEVLDVGTRHKAKVIRVDQENVFVAIGGRNEGMIPLRQFKKAPKLDAILEVIVKHFNSEDGLYEFSLPGASIEVSDWSDLTEGSVVEARITGSNTGGLECKVNLIRGFIPSSQIAMFRVEDFADYIDQKLPCIVTEVNPKRRNLVLSHRAYLERQREASRKQLLESLEVGQIHDGVVRKLQDFGAFVDIGGVDGLIHVSQLSWERVKHPKEVLSVGDKVRVRIEKINKDTGKIGLSYRDLKDHPWTDIESRFPQGTVVRGTVSRVANFGAFVKLAPGVEGLVHISELAHQRVPNVASVVSEGQEVNVKILSVDSEKQRIALSIRETTPAPRPEAPPESEEPAFEPYVNRTKKRLKGGMDRASGGEQFGLRW